MLQYIHSSLRESQAALDALLNNDSALSAIDLASRILVSTFQSKGRVFSCGNGGSMCDAMHFAEELTGRYRLSRPSLPASAISDPGHISCVGNDYGYDHVFSRYLEAHGRAGDTLVAISTSGSSRNILLAAHAARAANMQVIGLSGQSNEDFSSLCHAYVCTPAGHFADRVQELHIKVLHILIEMVERNLFPGNYASA
jgi:D-sedoheptulose 7-phosphate isomerase